MAISKTHNDVSYLRNRDLTIDFVELDKGFSMEVSEIRKDASL